MNKNIQYFVLYEDKQTQCFIRHFLYKHKINSRKIYFIDYPQSCGEQYVRENYPKELQKLRTKNFNSCALFVCIDADTKTVTGRYKELADECINQKKQTRQHNEAVAIFVPKRNIETWIKWLEGNNLDSNANVNEIAVYPHKRRKESECKPVAEKLANMFIMNANLDRMLPSMHCAKAEYDRLNKILEK